MSFNIRINQMDKNRKELIDDVLEQEYRLKNKNKERSEGTPDPIQDNMSSDEFEQMHNDGFIMPGIKIHSIRCRHCGNSKSCGESSEMYHTKVCGRCSRNLKNSGGIEI